MVPFAESSGHFGPGGAKKNTCTPAPPAREQSISSNLARILQNFCKNFFAGPDGVDRAIFRTHHQKLDDYEEASKN